MKIAVASSGLGHVSRGIETWALDTATALCERGVDVTLFAGGAVRRSEDGGQRTEDRDQRTEAGGRKTEDGGRRTEEKDAGSLACLQSPVCSLESPVSGLRTEVVSCWRRYDRRTQLVRILMPGFTWRWGFKDGYGIEQFTFWRHLEPALQKGEFDILHVQDPMLAYWCARARRKGRLTTKEILAHGTEESPEFLAQFDYLQQLAPYHLQQILRIDHGLHGSARIEKMGEKAIEPQMDTNGHEWDDAASGDVTGISSAGAQENAGHVCSDEGGDVRGHRRYPWSSSSHPFWVAIPNFVDTEVFRPAATEDEKRQCRVRFGVPLDAFVVGCSAAVKKHHKRIDYLIREFAMYLDAVAGSNGRKKAQRAESGKHPTPDTHTPTHSHTHTPCLLIAGASQPDTDELVRMAKERCGDRVKILTDVPREDMPDIYCCMDVFVLTSLFEMMPIAVLEALASGLPVIANDHPVLEWMVGVQSSEVGGQRSEDRGRRSDLGPPTSGSHRPGGVCIDMSAAGSLCATLVGLTPQWVARRAEGARSHAETLFSKDRVIGEYLAYYRLILCLEEAS